MFGITMRDIEMQDKIQKAGLTVAQAYEMRKAGTLPPKLAADLEEYEAALKADGDNSLTGESK